MLCWFRLHACAEVMQTVTHIDLMAHAHMYAQAQRNTHLFARFHLCTHMHTPISTFKHAHFLAPYNSDYMSYGNN